MISVVVKSRNLSVSVQLERGFKGKDKGAEIITGDCYCGFSFIELLVSLSIVALLFAIAIPSYNNFKEAAYDAQAVTNIKNLITGQEAYFVTNQQYFSGSCCDQLTRGVALFPLCTQSCEGNLPGYKSTKNVETFSSGFMGYSVGGPDGLSHPVHSLSCTSGHVNSNYVYNFRNVFAVFQNYKFQSGIRKLTVAEFLGT